MTSSSNQYRPRLTLRFGITGHRPPRLDLAHSDTIRTACAEIFNVARGSLVTLHSAHKSVFSDVTPEVKLVTSLAEGADVLAAEAALDTGNAIAACLPFPQDVYAKDFGAEEWARTEKMLAAADTVMSIDDHSQGETAAYEAAGRVVLAQSDILIAIWDGEAARGRGGTTQVIAEAVALHQPVIHIDAKGKKPPELLWSGLHEAVPDRPSLDGVQRADARLALPHLIEALCAPPDGDDAAELASFIAPQHSKPKSSLGWPLLLAATGAKPWSRISTRAPTADDSARWLKPHTEPFAQNGRYGERLNGSMLCRFGRADAQANDFALRFRSSFVTNFAMAGLAVFLALLGLLIPEAKKLLIALELLVILLIIANTRFANRQNLHRCWLDRRHLAERLRLLAMASPLGRLSLRDVEDGTTHPGWVSWYARASARELGLVRATFDRAYLQKVRGVMLSLIDEQLGYHKGNAHSMHHANHQLHRAGDLLFVGTIIACVTYLAISFGFGKVGDVFGMSGTGLVTFITALFPALAAALYGIRMQGDFAATGERSAAISHQLGKLRNALDADPLSFDRLAERSRRLGEIMLSEVQQWHLHYETRPMTLPG
ncbi:hypothetical protein [Sphingomicrobium marinum]|uniref:hypothetical protein n=1 Tax=Sphingomicrobium marinum TaxID=1227950 RepID=UPI002240775F|nr:hypothetical protein [Sphingomicrobium marinum]